MLVLNVGLRTNQGRTIATCAAFAAVAGRTRAVSCGVHDSDTEPTLVIVAETLSTQSAWAIAVQLRQDCIAVFDTLTKRGRLIGPHADAWGEFDAGYFIMPDGARLDPSYAAEMNAAPRGMECTEVVHVVAEAYRGE